jgi:hypothetical protein
LTGPELRSIREALGLSQQAFGVVALELGTWGGRTIRRYESGDSAIPGPVAVAARLLLEDHRRRNGKKRG